MENRIIRVAMIGFGGIAKSHKRGYEILAREGAPIKLVAICDINPEQFTKAQAINLEGKAKYDLSEQTLYTDLDLSRIDAVRQQLPILSARRTDLYEVKER